MMKNNPLTTILLIFFVSQFFMIPVYGQTPDSVQIPAPIWSDQTGIRDVLVQCSGDGRYVVSGSDTGILRMYDQTGTILWTFQREGKMVRSIAISRSGDYVGAVFLNPDAPSFYADGEILFFNRTGSVLWDYTRDYTVERIAISDDGNSIYASGSPKLYSFDRNGTLIGQNVSRGRTWALDVAGDGSYAVAGGTITDRIQIAGSQTPGNRIYVIGKDGTIAWNYSTKPGITSVGVSSEGGSIVSAGDSHLYSFDRNGTLMWQFNSSPYYSSTTVSSDGGYTAAGSQYYVRLFNRTGSLLWKYEYDGFVHDVGISDDGKFIVAGASRGVYVFDQKGRVLWSYATPNAVRHLSMANDGEYFVAGTSDTTYFFNRWGNATIASPVVTPISVINPPADNHTYEAPSPSASRPAPLPAIMLVAALVICAGALLLIRRIR
jgi:WD40 repeat protein